MSRHRSLRATVDWTLGLLDPRPRALFTRLGAFAGPVELAELEAVAGADGLDVLEALGGLLDVALVRRVESGDGRVRFGLPEALRQIAAEQLDAAPDGDAWRRAHAAAPGGHRLGRAGAGSARRPGADYRAALAADAEAAAALRWARGPRRPAGRAARRRARRDADLHGRVREAFALLEPLLERAVRRPRRRRTRGGARRRALRRRAHGEALAAAERALSIAVDPMTRVLGALVRGLVHTWSDDSRQACATARRRRPSHASSSPPSSPACWPWRPRPGWSPASSTARCSSWRRPSASARPWTPWPSGRSRRLRRHRACSRGARATRSSTTRARSRRRRRAGCRSSCGWTSPASPTRSPTLGEDAAALEVAGVAEAHSADMHGPEAPAIPALPGFADALARRRARAPAPRRRPNARRAAAPCRPGLRVTRACELARAFAARAARGRRPGAGPDARGLPARRGKPGPRVRAPIRRASLNTAASARARVPVVACLAVALAAVLAEPTASPVRRPGAEARADPLPAGMAERAAAPRRPAPLYTARSVRAARRWAEGRPGARRLRGPRRARAPARVAPRPSRSPRPAWSRRC